MSYSVFTSVLTVKQPSPAFCVGGSCLAITKNEHLLCNASEQSTGTSSVRSCAAPAGDFCLLALVTEGGFVYGLIHFYRFRSKQNIELPDMNEW